jgi:arylsulfatase A-like enzyme
VTPARARLAALAAVALAAAACGPPEPPADPPHGIILVAVDTLRADGLSTYGNPRPTSPAIDGLAADGVRFERALSHAPWTYPGFVGLLAGSYPSPRVLSPDRSLARSLVEPLRDAGIATAAFTEGAYVSRRFAMDRGFADFVEEVGPVHLQRPDEHPGQANAERTFGAAIDWLRANGDRRFFVMIHTYEVHIPYRHREYAESLPPGSLGPTYEPPTALEVRRGTRPAGETELAYVRALYDGGVRSVDRQVERLLAALRETGLADRTLIALTSDHGEDLGERDPRFLGWHGHRLFDEVLHVPLILHDPRFRWPVRRVKPQVRLIDVMPTLLDLAHVPAPTDLDGRSLVPLMLGREREDREALLDYVKLPDWEKLRPHEVGVSNGRLKLITGPPSGGGRGRSFELYDLADDPGERSNLAEARYDERERLLQRVRALRTGLHRQGESPTAVDPGVPDELRERLRALGYAD